MYTEFFKLRDNPFKQSPQASVFHPHDGIEDAYEAVLQGVMENQRIMLLTGATGTGKSLCAQKLVSDLDNSPRFACITLPFSSLSFDDVMDIICTGLNLRFGLGQNEDKSEILEMFLLHGNSPIKNIVIIIDEAQNLGTDTLNGLLKLCDLASNTERCIQLVVLARHDNDLKLNLPEMAEFSQQVAVREAISPIPPQQLADYIQFRLRAAGASYADLFTPAAVDRIFANTQGRPRAVNLLCDQTMDVAAASADPVINAEHVDQAQRDQHFDDTIEMRTSMISDAIARYANQPDDVASPTRDWSPFEEEDTLTQTRKPLFDLPDELDAPFATQHESDSSSADIEIHAPEGFAEPATQNKTTDQEPDTRPPIDTDAVATEDLNDTHMPAVIRQADSPAPLIAQPAPQSRKTSSYFAALIVLLALGGLGYFGYQYYAEQQAEIARLKAQLSSDATMIPDVPAEPANDPTALPDPGPLVETSEGKERAENVTRQIAQTDQEPQQVPEKGSEREPEQSTSVAKADASKTADALPPIAKTYPMQARTEALAEAPKSATAPTPLAVNSEEPLPSDQPDTKNNPPDRITAALEKAEEQIAELNLTEPEGNNALETYRKILTWSPENPDATAGLERIKGLFLQWADNNARSGKPDRAIRYFQKALLIDPDDSELPDKITQLTSQANTRLSRSRSPLHQLAATGQETALLEALQNEGNTNIRDERGNTPLMFAAENGHTNLLDQLLLRGADASLSNDEGDTALMNAAWNGHADAVQRLLTAGAVVDHANKRGWTALHYAAIHGHLNVFRALRDQNAKLNVRTIDGKTPVAVAAHNGHRELLSELLAAGASVDQTDQDDWTPLMHAVANNQLPVAQLLILNRADLNHQNRDGWTALMIAAAAGHDRLIDLLLEQNARTNLTNRSGQTAYDLAVENQTNNAERLR